MPRLRNGSIHAANTGRIGFVALQIHAADRAGAVVHVEVGRQLRVPRLERHRVAVGELLLARTRVDPSSPCSSPVHSASRTVRRMRRPVAFRMRIASIIAADPAALSVAPVPACQESKCAPSITTSSARSVPGISATMLNESSVSSTKRFWTFSSRLHRHVAREQPRQPVVLLRGDDDLRRDRAFPWHRGSPMEPSTISVP